MKLIEQVKEKTFVITELSKYYIKIIGSSDNFTGSFFLSTEIESFRSVIYNILLLKVAS